MRKPIATQQLTPTYSVCFSSYSTCSKHIGLEADIIELGNVYPRQSKLCSLSLKPETTYQSDLLLQTSAPPQTEEAN